MASEPIELRTTRPTGHPDGCTCGEAEENEIVLDTRQIPHAIRHATIFGALGAIAPGFSLDLIANHRPDPLVAQLQQRHPDEFTVSYLEEGPDSWRLRFTRR